MNEALELLRSIQERLSTMAFEIETLRSDVAAMKDAADSAEALLIGLSKKLDEALANSGDITELRSQVSQISDGVRAEASELAAAVVANTRP